MLMELILSAHGVSWAAEGEAVFEAVSPEGVSSADGSIIGDGPVCNQRFFISISGRSFIRSRGSPMRECRIS